MAKAFGIDIYDPQWVYLKDHIWEFQSNGMSFIIWKGTMGLGNSPKTFLDQVNQYSKDAGLLRGIYGWIDPIYPLQPQIDRFKGLIDLYKPDFVCGDFEQWWADWQQYWDYLNGKISGSAVSVLPANKVSQFGHDYMTKLKAFGLPTFLYTAKWFVDGYVGSAALLSKEDDPSINIERIFAGMDFGKPSKVMPSKMLLSDNTITWPGLTVDGKSWMGEFPLWEMDYWNKNRDKLVLTNWTELYGFLNKVIDYGPVLSQYWQERKMRQVSSVITLPHVAQGCRTDINIWDGTDAEMREYLKIGVVPDPEPEPQGPTQMTMVQNGVRIRWTPSVSGELVISPVNEGKVLNLAPNISEVEADGYFWEPVVVWVSRGSTSGTVFGTVK